MRPFTNAMKIANADGYMRYYFFNDSEEVEVRPEEWIAAECIMSFQCAGPHLKLYALKPMYNLTLPLQYTIELTSLKDASYISDDYKGNRQYLTAGRTYKATHIMPGYGLIGIIDDNNKLHYEYSSKFTMKG